MKLILKKAHVYFYALTVIITYFLLWPLFYLFSRNPSRYRNMNRIRRVWAYMSSALAGFFYHFELEEPVDWSKTYIVCPNHTSNLDIPAMCVLVNNNCSFMGKEELKDGIVTSLFFKSVDIPVNRESKMSSFRAFKEAAVRIQQGTTLIIFPEGKIGGEYPPQLNQFKNGPFRLAIELKVPIIPVSSANAWHQLWDTGALHGTTPGVCNFFVHKPIATDHLTIADADMLRDKVHSIIRQKIVENAVSSMLTVS